MKKVQVLPSVGRLIATLLMIPTTKVAGLRFPKPPNLFEVRNEMLDRCSPGRMFRNRGGAADTATRCDRNVPSYSQSARGRSLSANTSRGCLIRTSQPLFTIVIAIFSRAAPLPAITPVPIFITVIGVPLPVIIPPTPVSLPALIPISMVLIGILPVVMFGEGLAGITTRLAVIVCAVAVVIRSTVATGCGQPSGHRREQDCKKKYLHVHASITFN
jgi:hypothetical protein